MDEELKSFIRQCIYDAISDLIQPEMRLRERPSPREPQDPFERQIDRLEDITYGLLALSSQLHSWKSKGCLYSPTDIADILNRVKIIESKV